MEKLFKRSMGSLLSNLSTQLLQLVLPHFCEERIVSSCAKPYLLNNKALVLELRFWEKIMFRVPVRSSISSSSETTNLLILDTSGENGKTKHKGCESSEYI